MSLFPREQHPARVDDDEVGFVVFEGEAERTMEVLITVAAVMQAEVGPGAILPGEGDPEDGGRTDAALDEAELDGGEGEEPELDPRMLEGLITLKGLSDSRRELIELLLRRAVEGEEGVPDAELRAAAERAEATLDGAAQLLGIDRERAVEGEGEVALEEVAERIREGGLEQFDLSLHLGRHESGRLAAVWHPVPPETASVWLLGSLYDRVESSIATDALLSLERRASRWQFLQWSALRRGEEFQFAQGVREQEWSLVERPALATGGVPVIAGFCEQPFFEVLPPRQQALARALRRSFTGIFSVRAGEGEAYVFESVLNGRRYQVHEHNPEHRHRAGTLAVGRLIPWEGGLHLRSPGMMILFDPDPDLAVRFAEAMRKAEEANMPPPLTQEALISLLLMDEKVPRRVKPAESRAEARELVQVLPRLFEEYGLAEEASDDEAEEVPAELRALASERPDVKLMRYQVDDTVGEWMGELQKMASGPAGSPGGSNKAKGKRGKGRKKRR